MTETETVHAFVPRPGVNRVLVGADPRIAITAETPYETTDEHRARDLDKHPLVRRAPKATNTPKRQKATNTAPSTPSAPAGGEAS